MPERIPHHGVVVGTDGSASSQVALRWAAREATMRHLPLTVVHAAASFPVAVSALQWPAGRVPEEVLEIEENEGRRVIEEAVKVVEHTEGSGPEVNSKLFFGGALSILVDLSKDAGMVVVGCHGRTGRHRRLLGSVSAGLIHHAHCPVVVVHDEIPLSPQVSKLPVLVGLDGSHASELATEMAFGEASRRGVDLIVLHVCRDADVSSTYGMEWSALQSVVNEKLAERLIGWQERYPEVFVQLLVENDQPAHHLIEQSESAQLVVVGSHGRGGFAGMLLGSVSSAVAQEARVPVIVARRH